MAYEIGVGEEFKRVCGKVMWVNGVVGKRKRVGGKVV